MATKTKTKTPSRKSSRGSSKAEPVRSRGFAVIKWIEANCVFTQGKWIGQPFRLLPWQKRLILELFSLRPNGLRQYRWALWGVGKKNGKTELGAALALFFLIGDGEPSPLVVCAASSEGQADLVFGAAKRMCEFSPTLSMVTERYDKQILVPSIPGAVLKRVAAVAGANDGLNIHALIADELHEWSGAPEDRQGRKGRDAWNVLTNGSGARSQPMMLQITTAGYDRRTVAYEQYAYCKRIEAGEIADERYHFYWPEAEPDDDYRDPQVWERVNPSFGVTVQQDFYEDQVTKKSENVFRRYFLNQWTDSESAWLPFGIWSEGEEEGVEIPDGADVYLGVDIGVKFDSSAITWLWPRGDGKVVVKADVFTPRGDGTPLDLSLVEQRIRDIAQTHTVRAVGYDKALFERSAQMLSDEGFFMVEVPMSNERLVPATANLREAIVQHEIVHNGDPVLAAHVMAAGAKETERGSRLSKQFRGRPFDALMAMLIGFSVIERNAEVGFEWV
jgi:phage terminase large subunit-like protein